MGFFVLKNAVFLWLLVKLNWEKEDSVLSRVG